MEQDESYIDYGGGSGGYAETSNGGGGYDVGIDYADYYGGGEYVYDPSTGEVLDTGLQQEAPSGTDLFGAFFDYYSAQGYDDYTAMSMAADAASAGSIVTETSEQGPLPDVQYFPLPYPGPYDYWQSPPYIPEFPEGPAPPPPLPPSPASSQPNLPPACAAGTYHPYPIGHPQQNICVPFPPATTQAPKPPSATATGTGAGTTPKPPAPKPPSQQACPQGYYRAPSGQCLPIPRCTTPGTVYDKTTGRCVPVAQASAPACPPGEWFNVQTQKCEPIPACASAGTVFDVNRGVCVAPQDLSGEDIFGGLKNIPWWVWLAAGAVFLLSKDDGGRTTTVRHRRA